MWLVPRQTKGHAQRTAILQMVRDALESWYTGSGSEANHRAAVSLVVKARECGQWIACDCRSDQTAIGGLAMDQAAHRADPTGTAGVIARPPLIFLGSLALGLALDHLAPLLFPIAKVGSAHWVSACIAALMIAAGFGLAAAGIRSFSKAATPVPTNRPTRALVTTGVHRKTRNPIYAGMFLIYLGIGLVVRSPWILIVAMPLWAVIRYGVIAREEAYLEARFNTAYVDYKNRVRRWL